MMEDDIDSEISEIEQTISTDNSAYRGDAQMQARYLELLEAREAGESPQAVSPGDTEIASIQQRMQTDFAGYQKDSEMQARYLELLSVKEGVVASPLSGAAAISKADLGDPVKIIAEYRSDGKNETADVLEWEGTDLKTNVLSINLAALNVVQDIGDEDGANIFLESFNRLPDKVQSQTFDALLAPAYDQREATSDEIATFVAEDDAGETLVEEWGENAAYRLGVVKARTAKIFAGLSVDEKRQVEHFITSAPEAEWTAILRQLGDPDPVHARQSFKEIKRGR